MKEENELAWSSKDLQEWIAQGKMPKALENFGLLRLNEIMKQIPEVYKLKEEGASKQEILALYRNREGITVEDIENGLAFYKFVIENKTILAEIIGDEKEKKTKI